MFSTFRFRHLPLALAISVLLAGAATPLAAQTASGGDGSLRCSVLLLTNTPAPEGLGVQADGEWVAVPASGNAIAEPVALGELNDLADPMEFRSGVTGGADPADSDALATPSPAVGTTTASAGAAAAAGQAWLSAPRPATAGDYILMVAEDGGHRSGQWLNLQELPAGKIACINLSSGPLRMRAGDKEDLVQAGATAIMDFPEGEEGFANVPVTLDVLKGGQPYGIYSGFWPGGAGQRMILIIRPGADGGPPAPFVLAQPVVSEAPSA